MDDFYDIKNHLLEGEKPLWQGRPNKKMRFFPAERFNIILGIIWTVFGVLWMMIAFSVLGETERRFSLASIFPALAIPFLAIGVYLAIVLPLRILITRKEIQYALTDKRVMIIYIGKKEEIKSFNYSEIQNLNFGCDEDENGFVTFVGINQQSNEKKKKRFRKGKVYGLYNVSEVKKLYKIFYARMGEGTI